MSTAYIALPAKQAPGQIPALRGLIRSEDSSEEELATFIERHGLSPSGRTERVRPVPDGWIELERTLPGRLSNAGLREAAGTLGEDMRRHFPRIGEVMIC